MFKRGDLVVRRKVGETVEKVGKKIQPTKLKTGARSQPPQKSSRRVKREQAQKKLNTADTPAPYSPVLLAEWLPNQNDVIKSVHKVLYQK